MRRSHFRLILLTIFGATQLCNGDTVHPSHGVHKSRFRLDDILPANQSTYSKYIPPFHIKQYANGSRTYDPSVVRQSFYILSVDSINALSMTFSVDMFFIQKWTDHRLRYPFDSQHYNLNSQWLNQIWKPDSYFRNGKSMKFQPMPTVGQFNYMYTNKTIRLEKYLRVEISCPMDFTLYPHDTHRCSIQIESMTHFDSDMIYRFDRIVFSDEFLVPQIDLVNVTHGDCTKQYMSGRYPCLEVVFVLKRNMGYYLINSYIPTCIIVIVSWITFWIRPEALPARITLGVTSLLTLLTQHSKSQESLPRVSYLKVVDIFMLVSIIFVFASLVEMCVVIILVHGAKATAKKNVARKRRMRRNSKIGVSHRTNTVSSGDESSARQRRGYARQLDRVCKILFPLLFVVLNSLYWSWALSLN